MDATSWLSLCAPAEPLRQFSLAYGVPCISGKDSMKNDYTGGGERISIPPTVLFSILGVIRNVTAAQTSDFKQAGHAIYVLGSTWREMAGSEAATELGLKGGRVPHVDASNAMLRYRAVNALMGQRAISACHDCSDGGLAVAIAEMCIGGRLGAEINLDAVPVLEAMNVTELLYSESASRLVVSVKPDLAMILDALGMWQPCTRIGTVTGNGQLLTMKSGDSVIVNSSVGRSGPRLQAYAGLVTPLRLNSRGRWLCGRLPFLFGRIRCCSLHFCINISAVRSFFPRLYASSRRRSNMPISYPPTAFLTFPRLSFSITI